MRKALSFVALLALATSALAAADKFEGTWKLNTQKSTGPDVVTDEELVAVDKDGMQLITVTGKAADGTVISNKFSIPLKGGPGTIIAAAPFTGVSAKAATKKTGDIMFTIDGKPAIDIQTVLMPDGKTMKATREVISGAGKPGTYIDVWERQ